MAHQLNECAWIAADAGLGDFVVGGPLDGYFTPAQCVEPLVSDGALYHYRAESVDLSEHESGMGIWIEATETLQRHVVYQSSNAHAKVDFTLPPNVRMTAAAQDLGGPSSYERVTTSSSPSTLSPAVLISKLVTGGTGGAEPVSLELPSGIVNNGLRHIILLETQTDPGDTVEIDISGWTTATGGDINSLALDSEGDYVEAEWDESSWKIIRSQATIDLPSTSQWLAYQTDATGVPAWTQRNANDIDTINEVTGSGVMSATEYQTWLTTNGTGSVNSVSLPAGSATGQRKLIIIAGLADPADTVELDTSNIVKSDGTTPSSIVFDDFGEELLLEFVIHLNKWEILDRRYSCTVT